MMTVDAGCPQFGSRGRICERFWKVSSLAGCARSLSAHGHGLRLHTLRQQVFMLLVLVPAPLLLLLLRGGVSRLQQGAPRGAAAAHPALAPRRRCREEASREGHECRRGDGGQHGRRLRAGVRQALGARRVGDAVEEAEAFIRGGRSTGPQGHGLAGRHGLLRTGAEDNGGPVAHGLLRRGAIRIGTASLAAWGDFGARVDAGERHRNVAAGS
mmetsp:Transcript_134542/g.335705  ORF Transcript_134542/g.335705 Transcript_134542/m.335705 type:complete len:213 (-) Transcript_134542:622-1260(-)